MQDKTKIILGIYTVVVLFIFLLPIFLVIILSFNADANIAFPIRRFSLFWYVGEATTSGFRSGIINDPYIVRVISNSISLGIATALIATPLVTLSALALRRRFHGRDAFFYLLLAGFVIPAIISGIGMNILYKSIGVKEYSLWTALPLHVVYTVPFGLILTMARFDPEMVEYENAARALGASEWNVFRKITFPLIRAQVISAFFFSFTLSLGELLRTSFVMSGIGTIPTYVYNQMSVMAPTPKWFALGSLTTIISFILLMAIALFLTREIRRVT